MSRAFSCVLAIAVSSLALATSASAATHRHYHVRHHHYGHYRHARAGYLRDGSHVIPNVLVANPYGDVIIDGKTGLHRSDFGVMVPDTEPQSFVATGRAYGSGLGANGLPGQNWQ